MFLSEDEQYTYIGSCRMIDEKGYIEDQKLAEEQGSKSVKEYIQEQRKKRTWLRMGHGREWY